MQNDDDIEDQTGDAQQEMAAGQTTADGAETDPNPAGTSRGQENIEGVEVENAKLGSTNDDGGKSPAHGKQKQHPPGTEAETSKKKSKSVEKGPSSNRRKAFITLSYIVIAYVVCWMPFQFVFDISLARPETISADLYTAMFWLAYINSGLNPFMYAFSSADFRGAVVRMIKCGFCKP